MSRRSGQLQNLHPPVKNEEFAKFKGGLENAIEQASEKGFDKMFIVDTDAHQMEPFSLFSKYLKEPYKKKYARLLPNLNPDVEWYNSYQFADGRIKRPDVSYPHPQEPHELVREFADLMVKIGIKKTIILPNQMLSLGYNPLATTGKIAIESQSKGRSKDWFEFEVAVANAYIDYMIDNFLDKYPEILTMVYAPANSPQKAADLIDRVGSEKGVAGIMVTPIRPTLAGSNDWNPIYEVATKKGLAISFHAQGYHGDYLKGFKKYMPAHALSFPYYLALQLTSIVTEAVPERYPHVKFAFMEGGVSWIPWIMQRLDSLYWVRGAVEAPMLRKAPSEYIRRFFFTSQPLEKPNNAWELEYVFRIINAETQLMYASDYPHWDFDVPSVIYNLPFLSSNAKEKILGGNAANVYRLS
jgi:uncharacterized protein